MNTGLGPDVFVLDRHTAPDLDRQPVGVAVYVDNVGVVSQDSTLATITCTCIVAELEKHGLACKGVTAPSDEQGFTGLVFYRRSGRIAVSRSRAWRIRLAFLYAVSIGHLTGLELSKLVGHYTWSGLLRRPLLCVVGLAVTFMSKAGGNRRRLWSQVELELCMAADLIPFAYV